MRVGVVGGGITGLALTHYLAERGVDSVAYEADDQPGGVIDSRTVDGRVLEVGPQRLRLTEELDAMVDDLDAAGDSDGDTDDDLDATDDSDGDTDTDAADDAPGLRESLRLADDDQPLYVYANGGLRVVPRSASALLTTDLLSWRGKLRAFAEPLTAAGSPEESVAELFTRKFGQEAYENLVEPILGGTYGSDPARMPVGRAMPGVLRLEEQRGNLLVPAAKRLLGSRETPPPASFDEGLQQLPRALARVHDDRVELGTAVEDLQRGDDGVGVVLEDGRTERFDRVVVTVSAPAAGELLSSVAPDSAEALASLTYNPLALVHLDAAADVTGFGYQVRRSEPLRTLGVSWNASLFDRENLYTAFLGGMSDPEVMDLPEAEIGEIAAGEFEQVVGAPAEVLHVEKLPDAFPAYDRSWAALDDVDLPEEITLATNYTARMGIPSRVREAKRLAAEFAESA